MNYILFSDGKEIGEISEWKLTERPAIKKQVLGKEIGVQEQNDECQFVSPKPVKWKSKLWLISIAESSSRLSTGANHSIKLVLADLKVAHGTMITATVSERIKI